MLIVLGGNVTYKVSELDGRRVLKGLRERQLMIEVRVNDKLVTIMLRAIIAVVRDNG